METKTMSFEAALDDVSASSAGGAPFLIAYGATFLITAILSFVVERELAALLALFQGAVALPLAFWLERRMGSKRMEADNPLRSLSGLLAMSQGLFLPALIVVYSLNPAAIPVVMAGLGGMHFLPYAWLHRSRAYQALGIAVALGAFGLQLLFGALAFNLILIYISICYALAAAAVYRNAQALLGRAT